MPRNLDEIVRLWIRFQDGEGGGRNIFKRSLSASNSSMKRNDSLGDTAARSAGQKYRPHYREKISQSYLSLKKYFHEYMGKLRKYSTFLPHPIPYLGLFLAFRRLKVNIFSISRKQNTNFFVYNTSMWIAQV
jgi:hypothetical protein